MPFRPDPNSNSCTACGTAAHASGLGNAWVFVLAAGTVMGLALGARHVQGLFLLPITADRGWSRELFGLALAVQNLTWTKEKFYG